MNLSSEVNHTPPPFSSNWRANYLNFIQFTIFVIFISTEKEDEVTHLRPDVQRLVAPKPECFTAEEESEQELIFLLVVAILSAIAGAIIAVAGYISWQRKRGPSGSSTIELDDYGDDMYEDEDIFVEDEFPYEDYVPHGGREIPSDNKTVAVNETR